MSNEIGVMSSSTYYLQPITNNLLLTTYYLQLNTYYLSLCPYAKPCATSGKGKNLKE